MKKILYIISIVFVFIAPFYGEINIDFKSIFDFNDSSNFVFWQLRVPRVLLAFFVGAILALSGLVFQSIFKNALITPYTLGIASGTTLFSAVFIVFFPILPLFFGSIFGAIFSVLILFYLTKHIKSTLLKSNTNYILLIGVALSYFYSSALMLVFYLSNMQENYSIIRFTLGNLDVVGYRASIVVFITLLVMFFLINSYKKELKLLLISNDTAFLKGLNVDKTVLILLLFISLCVGISISFTGPIGFVGLVIPHIVKLIYKKTATDLFIPTLFFGGVFLVFCDFISRNLNTASSLPIGVVTAFIGAMFFVYLLVKRK